MAADLSPSTMRLALLSPIHGQSIDHIARQLENYRVFLAPFELRHYFHVSLRVTRISNPSSAPSPNGKGTASSSPNTDGPLGVIALLMPYQNSSRAH